MELFAKAKEFLKKLQDLPEKKKKIILWVIVAIIGIILAKFWLVMAEKRIADMTKQNSINNLIPELDLKNLPNLQVPNGEEQK